MKPAIADGHAITIHYRLTLDDGCIADDSFGGEPLVYLHGARNVVPGLERQLTGKHVGDTCEVEVPPSLHFLSADLARESVDEVLSRSPFHVEQPAFFSWLGVTMYLTREANLAALAAIARCGTPGSELVFTYLDQAVFHLERVPAAFVELQQAVSAVGEPFVSGFDPGALAADLESVGFELLEDLEDPELVGRYDKHDANELRPVPRSRIARARIK